MGAGLLNSPMNRQWWTDPAQISGLLKVDAKLRQAVWFRHAGSGKVDAPAGPIPVRVSGLLLTHEREETSCRGDTTKSVLT